MKRFLAFLEDILPGLGVGLCLIGIFMCIQLLDKGPLW